jgi:hypothetical protein
MGSGIVRLVRGLAGPIKNGAAAGTRFVREPRIDKRDDTVVALHPLRDLTGHP